MNSIFDGFIKQQEEKDAAKRTEEAKKLEEKAKKEKEKVGIPCDTQTGQTCTTTPTKAPTSPKKWGEIEVPAGVSFRFAGETVYTSEDTIKLEDARKKIAKEYPELTKELTQMKYLEKKKMVVVINSSAKGGQVNKGYFTSVEDLKRDYKPLNELAFEDGTVFEIRVNNIGMFSVITEMGTAPETVPFYEGFSSRLPRIPFELYTQIVSWFRHTAQNYKTEALVHVFYNTRKEEYFLYVPLQDVNGLSYETSDLESKFHDLQYDQDNVLVMDVHSHHNMPAQFSGIDNKYHVSTRLYAVVGMINKPFPDVTVRYSCSGKYREIPFNQLFENPFKDYPVEWDSKLVINSI